MTDPPQRTPEEREAARLERERRRTGLSDAGPDVPSPQREAPPPAAGDGHDDPPYEEDGHEEAPPYEADGHVAAPYEGDGHEEAPYEEHEDEIASGTRRVGWHERTAAAAAAEARESPPRHRSLRPRRGPRPDRPPRAAGTRSRRRTLVVRGAAILVLLIAAAVIWFCVELFQPFHGSGHGRVTVTIPAHAGARQVGNLLAREGVVASGFFFYIRATLDGDRGKLLAGTYHLKLDMSYGQALKALTTPPPAARVTDVTMVPGETRAQLTTRLRAEGITGSYSAATRRSPLLNPVAYGAPRTTPSLEGFLFPNTYQLREPISMRALIADQLNTFKQTFGRVNLSYARSRHLTPYDVLIIASIVEKESATAHDDPLVASVIYNRLKDGIPLGMDSTTRYEFNDYTHPLTNAQLSANSPYNTRRNSGLPPTPISNPGLVAIEAAARPAHTHYLYFVVKPCGNGASVFSSSYNQFLADSARYQRARSAKGGRSPTKC